MNNATQNGEDRQNSLIFLCYKRQPPGERIISGDVHDIMYDI